MLGAFIVGLMVGAVFGLFIASLFRGTRDDWDKYK